MEEENEALLESLFNKTISYSISSPNPPFITTGKLSTIPMCSLGCEDLIHINIILFQKEDSQAAAKLKTSTDAPEWLPFQFMMDPLPPSLWQSKVFQR